MFIKFAYQSKQKLYFQNGKLYQVENIQRGLILPLKAHCQPWCIVPENRISWIPWHFPDLKNFLFFPDFSLTVATLIKCGVWHLQTADRRLHEAARLLIEWNQKYRNKGGVIINITLFREVRPRSEVYIFHANYTDVIPKGAVGCSFHIELEQNNVCWCHKLAHESIATV